MTDGAPGKPSHSTRAAMTIATADTWPTFTPSREPTVRAIVEAMSGPGPNAESVQVGQRLRDIATADIVVQSVFGDQHLLARGTTVGMSMEPRVLPDHLCDWTIDWRWRQTDTHCRMPVWAAGRLIDPSDLQFLDDATADPRADRRFCNFIYSNPRCATRNSFFEMLHRHEPVDALGRVHNNATHPLLSDRLARDWFDTKVRVLRDYRFTIAFENEEHPGYSTEKMFHAWLADSVPIFWGDPLIDVDFPPGSYLSLYEAGTVTRLVEQVLEAHHDPARYEALRMANPLRTGRAVELAQRYRADLINTAQRIVDDAERFRGRARKSPARRLLNAKRYVPIEARNRLGRRFG